VVVWAALGVIALSLLATWVRAGNPLVEIYYRTVSLTATGPYTAAGLIDWSSADWHDWPGVMREYRELSQHVALSPPGLPLVYAGASHVFEQVPPVADALQRAFVPLQCDNTTLLQFSAAEWAAAAVGLLMPVWASLAFFRWRRSRADALDALRWRAVGAGPGVNLSAGRGTVNPRRAWRRSGCCCAATRAARGDLVDGRGAAQRVLTFATSRWRRCCSSGAVALLGTLNSGSSAPAWFTLSVGAWFGLGWRCRGCCLGASGSAPEDMLRVALDRHLALDRRMCWLGCHAGKGAARGLPIVLLGQAALARRRPGGTCCRGDFRLTILLLLSGTARARGPRVPVPDPVRAADAVQWIAGLDGARRRY